MLHFVTGNPKKFAEVAALLPGIEQREADLVEIQSLDSREIVAHKIAQVRENLATPFFVDDTGLEIPGFGQNFPGPLVKFFLQAMGVTGLRELARNLPDKTAISRTVLGFRDGAATHFFVGETRGTLVAPARADQKYFDAIFVPQGFDRVFADFSVEEKNRISHRGRAIAEFRAFLGEQNFWG